MKNNSLLQYFDSNQKLFKFSIPIIAFLLYANSIGNSYNLDDELVTINHRNTSRGLSAVTDIFSQYYYEDEMGYKYEYRPITHLSFALEHELLGESPHISHFINVVLYALLCYLSFTFLSLLFPFNYRLLSWVATLFFVFHPIHTEVVASIKNRDELLAIIFALSGGILLLKFNTKFQFSKIALVLFCFTFSLLSKSTIIVFIVAITIVSFRNLKFHLFLKYTLFFIVSITSLLVLFYFFKLENYTLLILILFLLNIVFFIFQSHIEIDKSLDNFLKFKIAENIKISISTNLISLPALKKIYFSDFIFYTSIFIINVLFLLNKFIYSEYKTFFFITIYFITFLTSFSVNLNKKRVLIFILTFMNTVFASTVQLTYDSYDLYPIYLGILFSFLNINHIISITLIFSLAIFNYYISKDLSLAAVSVIIPFATFIFSLLKFKHKIVNTTIISIWVLLAILDNVINGILTFTFIPSLIFSFIFLFSYFFFNGLQKKFILPLLFSISLFQILGDTFIENKKETALVIIDSKIEIKNSSIDRPLTFIEAPVNFNSSLSEKMGTGMVILSKCIPKLIIGYKQGFYYGYSEIEPTDFYNFSAIGLFTILTALLFISFYLNYTRYQILSIGLFFLIITIIPSLSIAFPIPGMMGDRFLFQPSIGFSILIAYPFYKAIGTKWQKIASYIFIGILTVYGFLTIQRNAQWKDHLTLFRHDIKYLDKSVQAHNLLAIHLNKYSFNEVDKNKRIAMQEEAALHFKRAIEIYPKFSNLHFDLGRTYLLLNKLDEALLAFKEAAKLDTTYSESFNNVAAIYQQKGMNKEAIEYYKKSLEIYKFNPLIYTNLSFIYFQTGDFESSLNISREALTHIPNNIEPYENIGKTFYGMGLKDSSIVYFEKAHQLFPNHPNTIDALARLYTEKKDPRANYFMQLLNQMQSQNR